MISDESDDDADTLDDDALLEAYIDPAPKPGAESETGSSIPDWPPVPLCNPGPALCARTLAWFKASQTGQRLGPEEVLRGWITSRAQSPPDPDPPGSVEATPV
jgi:hypothetical protein